MVQMTSAMLNAAVAEAQAQAKAEGKGFFGIMKDQLAAQFRFALRYETMNPDMALAETPGNLSVENARITAINMKLRDTGSGEVEYTEFKMVVESADGKFEYMMAEDDRYVNLLKQVYGDRVHMPFGYFRTRGFPHQVLLKNFLFWISLMRRHLSFRKGTGHNKPCQDFLPVL